MPDRIYWQAHQSTSPVMPENTLAAFEYAWKLGGIPEADIRTTGDGKIICLHDPTLKRTTDAPDPITELPVSALTFRFIRQFNVGGQSGIVIPTLKEVFAALKAAPDRLLYLDLKDVDLIALARLIRKCSVAEKLIFSHNCQKNCERIKELIPQIRTMLWIGGEPREIEETFQKALATNFRGLDQVQIHLYDSEKEWPYQVGLGFIEYALKKTQEFGVDLEVLPFQLHQQAIHTLLDLGIRWFAVDYPQEFLEIVALWRDSKD
jgi:glycerophosphoryl diester phosphodiesterase